MANPTCTQASFIANTACYKNFNAYERASILIYLNSLELAALGGTSYTLGSGGTLEAAALCYRNMPQNDFTPPTIYQLLVANNNAVAAGASVAATQAALATAIACSANFQSADLAAQMLQLQCSLGVHKAYPQ